MGKRRRRKKQNKQNPLGRAKVPPPGHRWTDKKKARDKKAARGKVDIDTD